MYEVEVRTEGLGGGHIKVYKLGDKVGDILPELKMECPTNTPDFFRYVDCEY